MTPARWFIYVLRDPRTMEVRYVGFTTRPAKRFSDHINPNPKDRSHRARWIRSLRCLGLRPLMEIVEEGTGSTWQVAEKKWIRHHANEGRLTNLTDGGDGTPGRLHSEETRARISAARRGKGTPWSEERRRAPRYKPPPEIVEKAASFHRGRKRPAESCAKMSITARARGIPAARRQQMAASFMATALEKAKARHAENLAAGRACSHWCRICPETVRAERRRAYDRARWPARAHGARIIRDEGGST